MILGVPPLGTEAAFDVSGLYQNKSIMGCRYGASRPRNDIPVLVDLYLAGQLKLDELVSRTYKLEQFDEALADLHAGNLARGVFTFLSDGLSPTSTSASPTGAAGATTTRSARSTSSTTRPCGGASTACAPGSA